MKKRTVLNFCSSFLTQLAAIGSGLIIPRLILLAFGSENNGLISSINQLLSYITLVEGGLGSVVLAEMYKPLAHNDYDKLRSVVRASERYFRQLAGVLLLYCLVLGAIYPFLIQSSFDWGYIFSLTLILSANLFSQYFFAVTYRLILEADQKVYYVQLLQITTYLINLILTVLAIKTFKNIHLVKLVGAVAYLIQPLALHVYVKKRYPRVLGGTERATLPQRWACFSQNLAYFVHSNTDIVILSLFCGLTTVSVYSVYSMVVKSIRNLAMAVSRAYTPIIGQAIATKDNKLLHKQFDIYEFFMYHVSTVLFGCCNYLITSFVVLYTKDVLDADYYQPLFGVLLTTSELIYCIRDPYVTAAYAAGHFSETAKGAYAEAGINIFLSLFLVRYFGLVGVAIGTIFGMLFRMLYQIWYLRTHLLYRSCAKALKRNGVACVVLIFGYLITKAVEISGENSWRLWIKNGFLNFAVNVILIIILSIIFDGEIMRSIWKVSKAAVLKRRS